MNRLLPTGLRNRLPPLYAQQGIEDPTVHAKFFFPAGGWTWLVTEGEPEGDYFTFFGYVIGFETECGYFSLKELEEVNVKGVMIERDCYFEPDKLSSCLSNLNLQ
jgi:hypothetical protein